jgi:hypothetical protein
MVEPLRHRQTKGAATDMFYLMPPRHISTLQILLQKSKIEELQKSRQSRLFDVFVAAGSWWDRYGGRWSIWCETMWSLTSPRAEHASEPERFHWSVKRDFFNTIEG